MDQLFAHIPYHMQVLTGRSGIEIPVTKHYSNDIETPGWSTVVKFGRSIHAHVSAVYTLDVFLAVFMYGCIGRGLW